jgi:hypothetical protein
MESVFTSALVDARPAAQTLTPAGPVAEQDCTTVLPLPEAPNVGVTPGTGLPRVSRSVMTMLLAAVPLATMGEVPVTVDWVGSGGPALQSAAQ